MILSDRTLFKMLEAGTLSITPLDKEQVQPASVDIRLGNTFSIVEDLSTGVITLKDEVGPVCACHNHGVCFPA